MLRIFLLIAVTVFPSVAFAEEKLSLCRSPYALMSENFNYRAYKESLAGVREYTVVTLWNTFGNKLTNYAAELADPRVVGTELALLNETCVTNGNCGDYEVLFGYDTRSLSIAINSNDAKLKVKVQKAAQNAWTFLQSNLRTEQFCMINPLLETKMKPKTWQKLVAWIQPIFGNRCEFVWNPRGADPGIAKAPATYSEAHGVAPHLIGPNCVANPDGTVIADGDYTAYLENFGRICKFACLWGLNDNCNYPGSPRLDPRQRSCAQTDDFVRLGTIMKSLQ